MLSHGPSNQMQPFGRRVDWSTKSLSRHRESLVQFALLQFLPQFTLVLCVDSLPDHYHMLCFPYASFYSAVNLGYHCVHAIPFSSLVSIRHCHIPRVICDILLQLYSSVCIMLCLILLHLFACCITLIVVKPVISKPCTVITSFIEEYASEDED